MFTRMRLENFKSWQSLDIEMAPLTLLFGTNSSGKSSVLQAILLILQSHDITNWGSIYFGGNPNDYVNLGSYNDIVFQHDVINGVNIYLQWRSSPKLDFSADIRIAYVGDEVEIISGQDIDTTNDLTDILYDTGIHYLGPLRQHPQRSYLWSGAAPRRIEKDGANTIAALIESTRRDGMLLNNVAEWLIEMELVEDFRVNPLDKDNRFYETQVEIGTAVSNLLDVGFGVSQVLPVITTLFFVPEGSIVLLEQPELHLHPRAQAHLADLMLHVAEERKLQLIVESHSEHILRRLQRRIAEEDHAFANPENIKMYFCDRGENGSTIQPVGVDEFGQISNWPENFFGDITGDLEAMTMAALKRSVNGKN